VYQSDERARPAAETTDPHLECVDRELEAIWIERCVSPRCQSDRLRDALSVSCPYSIAGTEREFHLRFTYCEDCGLGFVNPRPSADVLAAFYRSDYPYHGSARRAFGYGRIKLRIASWRHRHIVSGGLGGAVLGWAASAIEKTCGRDVSYSLGVPLALSGDATMLDFGCGNGAWLIGMRRVGYSRLYGFALDNTAGRLSCLQSLGITVLSAEDVLRAASETFDVVRLEHVFEHLLDPSRTLREIMQLLRPGGWLVMTMPSIYPWLPIDKLKNLPALPHLQLPIHLTHHSIRSLSDFVLHEGYEIRGLKLITQYRYLTIAAMRPAAL